MLFTVLIIMAYILQIDISVGQFEPGSLALFAVGMGNFARKVYKNDKDAVSSFYRKKKEIYQIQYISWTILVLLLVQIVYSFFDPGDYSMLLGLSGIAVLVLSEQDNICLKRRNMDAPVMMNIILSLLIIMERLFDTGFCELLKLKYSNQETAGVTLLLGSIITAYMYITESYVPRERLYMYASILSLIALVINGHMISVGLMLIGVLMYPLVLIPTVGIIEKSSIILAACIAVASNASIVFLMLPEAEKVAHISIEASICLDIILAIGVVCYSRISAIIPQNVDKGRIFVHRLEKLWTVVCVVLPVLLAICGSVGGRLNTEEGNFINKALTEYGSLALESRQASQPWIYTLLVNTNVVVSIVVIGAFIAMGMAIGFWIRSNNVRYYPAKGLCMIVAVVSFLGFLYTSSSILLVAIYVYMAIFIYYGNEKEIKYKRSKWNGNRNNESDK